MLENRAAQGGGSIVFDSLIHVLGSLLADNVVVSFQPFACLHMHSHVLVGYEWWRDQFAAGRARGAN